MTKAELLKALRIQILGVRAAVHITENDVKYFKIIKTDFITYVRECPDDMVFNTRVVGDSIYIG